jgi:hypothetical protein
MSGQLSSLGRCKIARPQPGPGGQRTLLACKGSEASGLWLEELVEFSGPPITNTLDVALQQYAERIGFSKSSPKRQSR